MANWTWTEALKTDDKGAYRVTATDDSTPARTISFVAHKARVTPALLVSVLQEKVTKLEADAIDKINKLQYLTNNVNISGVG